MRNILLLILIILCLALPSSANVGVSMMGASVGGGATCTTPDNGNELDEGFLGTGGANSGYENSGWTENIGADGIVDQDAVLPGTPPTGSCTEGLKITALGANTWAYWDHGSAINQDTTDLNYTIHIYFDTLTLTNLTSAVVYTAGASSTPDTSFTFELRVFNNGGTYQLKVDSTADTTYYNIAVDTWYTIKIHSEAGDAGSESTYSISPGSDCTEGSPCTFTTTYTIDSRYFVFGTYGIGAGEEITMYIGYESINSAAD